MIEIIIHGRGGQGGVTLAKLIATAYFLRGKDVQAFGVYAAERSGAPIQAFVRVDDEEITNHNQVTAPDHVIVLDRTLIGPGVADRLKPDGWLILNTSQSIDDLQAIFPGRPVATINATAIALNNGLGTRTVPIVNTTMAGAVARVFGLSLEDVRATLAHMGFGGANIVAAESAFADVAMHQLSGAVAEAPARPGVSAVSGILDADIGGMPALRTGQWATSWPQRQNLLPPCNHQCPAGNDVQGFLAAASRGESDAALAILMNTSPLPGICGRVCPAPCMEGCNRQTIDDAVNVREVERHLGDHGSPPAPTKPWREQAAAVVGSGPAGLSAAYHLARLGYPVTLYEGEDELGGVLRNGIPTYRLPRDVLDREIRHILAHGVQVQTRDFIDPTRLLELSRRYAAVFVATGLQRWQTLDLGPENHGVVLQGLEFLDRVRQGRSSMADHDVVVVGGGNTAVDAARSARRIGARSVRMVYRRTRAEMPAIREEVEEAVEEGIHIDELVQPVRLHHDGVGPVLTCQRMMLGEPDASGRPRPIPIAAEDAWFDLRCDRVILALGQSADLSILPEGAEIRDKDGFLGLASAPVFAGGDLATNEGTVAAAIGNGRRAAWHIHRTLTGEDLFPPAPAATAGPEVIKTHVFKPVARQSLRTLGAHARRHSFEEVRRGFDDDLDGDGARAEAGRCLSCGVCNQCDRCLEHCPDGVLQRDGNGYRFDYDYCKGCAVCATQCPRGVIYMAEL